MPVAVAEGCIQGMALGMDEGIPYRKMPYGLVPGSESFAVQLARIAGAWRWVWNGMLDTQWQCPEAVSLAAGKAPRRVFRNMFSAFTQRRRTVPWLQE